MRLGGGRSRIVGAGRGDHGNREINTGVSKTQGEIEEIGRSRAVPKNPRLKAPDRPKQGGLPKVPKALWVKLGGGTG